MKDCSNCQIGPYGGCIDINRPDIKCSIHALVDRIGVWDLAHGKRFYCSAYHKHDTPYESDKTVTLEFMCWWGTHEVTYKEEDFFFIPSSKDGEDDAIVTIKEIKEGD